jgi:hypothetical protein
VFNLVPDESLGEQLQTSSMDWPLRQRSACDKWMMRRQEARNNHTKYHPSGSTHKYIALGEKKGA